MSGVIMMCGQQQLDSLGAPLAGGLVYMLQSGTLVPQNGFRDQLLINAYPNPLALDASGRVPVIWFADGTIRIRLTDASGVLQFDSDLPILGVSSGGPGGTPIDTSDPTTRYITGDMKFRYGGGPLAGYVRCNGLTIGPPSSGATERANADCQALFTYLWGLDDGDLVVLPSRGSSAAQDWAATSPFKTLKLPDYNGILLGCNDGGPMGSPPSGRLSLNNFVFGKGPNELGAAAGREYILIDLNSLPSHSHGITDPTHSHAASTNAVFLQGGSGGQTGTGFQQVTGSVTVTAAGTGITINNTGNSQALYTLPPVRLVCFYLKL